MTSSIYADLYMQFRDQVAILLTANSFNIDENFVSDWIHSDWDKDLIVDKHNVYFTINCKFKQKAKIGFNDIELISSAATLLDSCSVIVTTTGYSKNSITTAQELEVILADSKSLIDKLNKFVDDELARKFNETLYKALHT
ncbi:19309_t:CDS:2 [Dentiscutata erythropus]|uniref:19309_t:CDS:1 n=1 Tax=Dentiscutata erythropus TaxID=1348616 RepID=A0A9N9HFN4_9GLOM|nr:19309_t:CDS:2 [Dentiscutata erythropus]